MNSCRELQASPVGTLEAEKPQGGDPPAYCAGYKWAYTAFAGSVYNNAPAKRALSLPARPAVKGDGHSAFIDKFY